MPEAPTDREVFTATLNLWRTDYANRKSLTFDDVADFAVDLLVELGLRSEVEGGEVDVR